MKLTQIFLKRFYMNIPGLPSVVTMSLPMTLNMHDGIPVDEACRRLEEAGADVVGLNCGRGPGTMVEPLKIIRKACKVKKYIICEPFSVHCAHQYHYKYYKVVVFHPGLTFVSFTITTT